jgi:hypothetical protein
MKKRLLLVSLWVARIGIASGSLDTDKIDQATGLKGKLNEKEGVYKVTFPRDDVKVRCRWLDDAAIHGARNLGGIQGNKRGRDGDA